MTRRRTRIVGIGGGTGLSVLLAGLRQYSEQAQQAGRPGLELTGIVSVTDDGGSTGVLRQQRGIPAVGDLRSCIVALSRANPLWGELFQHRFSGGDDLDGHALGNLIMAALVERSGGLQAAVDQLTRPLRLHGRVLPVSEQALILCAELEGGEVVCGESQIRGHHRRIERVWLRPHAASPAKGVLEAIAAADGVVLGPGSLYTSVIPNLLVDEVAAAVRRSPALKIFVCNLMTEPGETAGFGVLDHLAVLERHLGAGTIDVCLLNGSPLPAAFLERQRERGAEPVRWDRQGSAACGAVPVPVDLVSTGNRHDLHDPAKLAAAVVSLARSVRPHPAARARELPDLPARLPLALATAAAQPARPRA